MAQAPPTPARERHIARCVERAAAHQTRALAWLREARDPANPLTPARRRALLLLSLEHLLLARHLLQRARRAVRDAALSEQLAEHLARLATIVESTERRLQEVDHLTQTTECVTD